MPRQFTIGIVCASGIQDIVLDEIDAETATRKHLFGTAYGTDLEHCFYLGSKNGKNFQERVKYYRLIGTDETLKSIETHETLKELFQKQPGSIGVVFYGEKEKIAN